MVGAILSLLMASIPSDGMVVHEHVKVTLGDASDPCSFSRNACPTATIAKDRLAFVAYQVRRFAIR